MMLNFSHRKALEAHSFPSVIWPLVTFWENYFFKRHSSGHTDSNDTGLEFLSCQEAEKKGGQTYRQTDFGYYYIDLCSGRYFREFKLSSLESKLSIETRESRRESRLSKFSKFSITNIVK